jgi:hypothetical protein
LPAGNNWNYHGKISLEFLEEVNISGFTGRDEEIDLVHMFQSSNLVKSMTLKAAVKKTEIIPLKRVMAEEDGDEDYDSEVPVDNKLMNIPYADWGHWHFGETMYTWSRGYTIN